MSGAKRNAALAVNALCLVAHHKSAVGIKKVNLIGTLSFADTAGNATVIIPSYLKIGKNI